MAHKPLRKVCETSEATWPSHDRGLDPKPSKSFLMQGVVAVVSKRFLADFMVSLVDFPLPRDFWGLKVTRYIFWQ